MKIHIKRARVRSRYPLRPTSFVTSAAIHACLIAALLSVHSARPAAKTERPLYETEIKPNEKKIIWYNFREIVPNVPATRKIGTTKDPQGAIASPRIVIATSPDASKSSQFIWQPTPEKKIDREIKAPNLVAVSSPPADADSSPVKPEDSGPAVVKQPPRRFQPTPQPAPQIPLRTPTIIDAPPPGSVLGGSVQAPDVPSTAFTQSKIPPKRFVPHAASRPGAEAGSGNPAVVSTPAPEISNADNVNMAIVGLHPSDLPPPISAGSLPGQFSTAPKIGKASTGDLPLSASGVPNLVVEGGPKIRSGMAEPTTIPTTGKMVLYRQVASGPMPSTLSAPLRPGTRTIPGALEARFQGLNVYTMVLPAPNLPGYAGDWVLWFAERQPEAGAIQMRAPVPLRKKILEQGKAPAGGSVVRVQVTALVGKDGTLEQVRIWNGGGPGVNAAIIEDLKAWEFTPATRNMVPVEVDVVLDIPFRLAR
jgi:TonB-like protein